MRELREREQAVQAYATHPALLRLQELVRLSALAQTANARIHIDFDGHARTNGVEERD